MKKITANINIIFILTLCLILASVSCFNYIVNPYNIFRTPLLNINTYFNYNPFLQIKLSKKYKYSSVIVGGSSVKSMDIQKRNKDMADISIFDANIYDTKRILIYYLDAHPETKIVYLPIDLHLFKKILDDSTFKELRPYNIKHITIEEIYHLLLSNETTKKSFDKLMGKVETQDIGQILITTGPKVTHKQINPANKIDDSSFAKANLMILAQIFDELEKRNIETICFLSPIQIYYQIELNDRFEQQIDEIKKYIVKRTGRLTDMSTINKFTTMPPGEANLFVDKMHPTGIYGNYVRNIIINSENKDKDLYIILTENNIDAELKKYNTQLQNYKKAHFKEYMQFKRKKTY